MNLQRVLVTGGVGFIGANVVRLLIAEDCQVTVLDNLTGGRREYVDGLSIDFIQGNVLDAGLLKQIVPGHGSIVALAAQSGVRSSVTDPRRDFEVNVIGTLNLLEAARAAGVRRFVFASSNAVLGRQQPPAIENKAPLPISPYGASKLAGEAYCLAYDGSLGLASVVLRFGNVYGPFSAHKNSVVANFFKDILVRGQIMIDGDGDQTRDFIYAGDLGRAVLLAVRSEARGEVLQIATGVQTSIRELAAMVREVVGRPVGVQHGPARPGDVRRNYSVIAKARAALGWEPKVALGDGLRETWEWFRQLEQRSLHGQGRLAGGA